MKTQRLLLSVVAPVLLLSGLPASAAEFKSGLQKGERRGCLSVIWLVNYHDDNGYFNGCLPCCMNTAGPVAIVFIRSVDDRVAELILALDLQLTGDRRAFVCAVGGFEHEHLKKAAGSVPLTIPGRAKFAKDQIAKYKLNDKAAVTVIVYESAVVTLNFAFAETKDLTRQEIKKIVKAFTSPAESP